MRHYILVIMLAVCAAVSAQNDRQLIREGNRLYRQKQYAQAEVLYRKAIAKKADNPQAVYNLGCALMMQQKDSAAIVQYENATKLEKNKLRQSKSWHNIGVMCQSHKMYGEAVRAYEQSLRLNPSDDETRYNLALCKQLNKNNPQQDKNQQDKKNEEKEDDKGQQQKKDKKDQQKEEQPKEQMSKDNAERLLDAAVQNEKATQQRLKKALQQPRKKQLQKNW
ncbi:MAG: tetratricopeptide repeat protein [Prevotella sp.]|nr:tetratricopeptide repeat protein [Prevotella sp.]MBR6885600.1 tetratricopeptide repeat protein [Prevotella sp.]